MNEQVYKKLIEVAKKKYKAPTGKKGIIYYEDLVIECGLSLNLGNIDDRNKLSHILGEISGQQPVKALAKKSIAGFKIREGMPIGTYVTLRGLKMFVFLNKLINLTLPKVRDFQGTSNKLDGKGSYNLGIKDINVFPEAEVSGISELSSGLNITIVTNSKDDKKAKELLVSLGMPFVRK